MIPRPLDIVQHVTGTVGMVVVHSGDTYAIRWFGENHNLKSAWWSKDEPFHVLDNIAAVLVAEMYQHCSEIKNPYKVQP